MKTRTLSGLALLASTLLATVPGFAQSSKTVEPSVDNVEVKDGKARVSLSSGLYQGVLPGDKGFFTKDGEKVAGSDFEIDRIDDTHAWANTVFPTGEDLRARTSAKARIAATRTCPRGGARPNLFDDKEVTPGTQPAEGFAFAKVTSVARVHKSEISFTIDKGTDDGVLPSSSAYALAAGPGRPLAPYVSISWVTAKTAGGTVTAGDADELLKIVKRIGYERLVCKGAK
jgi:hypothetical protein